MGRQRRRLIFGGIAALWILYLLVILMVYLNHPIGAGDYGFYYRGTSRLIDGTPLYDNLNEMSYVGPPLILQFFEPILWATDETTTSIVWFIVNAITTIGALSLISGQFTTVKQKAALWLVPLLFMPLFYALWLGNASIIILGFTVAAWYAHRTGKPYMAGALLAFPTWIKFYPGLIILYFMWKRDWRTTLGALVMGILLLIFQVARIGWESFWFFFREVLPGLAAGGQLQFAYDNQSILGFAQRLFQPVPQVIPLVESDLIYTITRFGLMIAVSGIALYCVSKPIRLSQTSAAQFDIEFSLVTVVALLLGATLWLHGMTSTLLAFALVVYHRQAVPLRSRFRVMLLLVLSAVLMNSQLFVTFGALQPNSGNQESGLLLSIGFYGMMLLWGVTAALLVYQRAALSHIENHPVSD